MSSIVPGRRFPTVYRAQDGGHCYSSLVVTDTDAPVQAGSGATKYYLRSYIQHRHQGQPSGAFRTGGHYVAHFRNSNVWYTADDTATTVRRQQDHKLPAVAFFELLSAHAKEDWPLVDPGALSREPEWLQSALEVLSALQLDSEWLLGLSEDEQLTIAEVASAATSGVTCSASQMDSLFELLAGGARGTAHGPFQPFSSESETLTDSDHDDSALDPRHQQQDTAHTPTHDIPEGSEEALAFRRRHSVAGNLLVAAERNQERFRMKQQDPSRRRRDQSGRQQDRSGRQQDRSGRQQDRACQQRDRSGRQPRREEQDDVALPNPVAMFTHIRSLPAPRKQRESLREFPQASADPLPPVFCMLCPCNFCVVEALHVHIDEVHGGLQRYRHVVLHLLSLRPFVLTPFWSRAIISNFSEFYTRGSLDWRNFTADMHAAVRSSCGLSGAHRWESRRMIACVCCARMFWSEDLSQLHITGPHADWIPRPEEAWSLLSADAYSCRAPLIPRSELQASAVPINGQHVLLHKRRCSQSAVQGLTAVPWCQVCARALSKVPPQMPWCALANHNWLGRLTTVQQKLLTQEYLGHRLLLSLARAVTSKVVFRPNASHSGRTFWQDAYRAKGMTGSGIVFDNARRTQTESFPPPSLGGSFIALFVGCDPQADHGLFGKIDAAEFVQDASVLRQVNEVYAQAHLDNKELAAWPKDGKIPQSLRECCVALPEDGLIANESPGRVGPAQMTSHGDATDVHVVPPWTSAIDPAAEDDTTAPVLWSTLSSKLEEAADLGSRIKIREAEARVQEGSDAIDEVSRELLLKTCGTLGTCFKKLSRAAQDARFEELCGRVVQHSSIASTAVGSRLAVPTGKKPLDLFDHRVWTKIDPVCFWYNDCVWGHPSRPRPVPMGDHHEMCMRREELEYSTEEEVASNRTFTAPAVNRFRTNYRLLHIMQTSWSLEQKIRSVYAFTHRPGNRRTLSSFAKLSPQMLSDCYTTVAEHKSIGAVMRDKEHVPAAVRRALDAMQVATQDVLNTDGHRRLLRHEGNAYATRFGACAVFTTPNFPQQRHATFLLTRSEVDDHDFSLEMEFPELGTLGDMMKKQADDPVGLAMADDIVFRLFQLHVFGVREDLVGIRRGRPRERLQETVWDNSAAATSRLGIAGPPQAGHGPLESSGRFQLHGHWRWWFRSLSYQRLVELCKQQPEVLEDRLREVTTEAIRSIMSIQGTSVAQLPRSFGDATGSLEPLPLLHWQNIDFGGDGGFEKTSKGEASSLKRPKLDSVQCYPTEVSQPDGTRAHPFKQRLRGTTISSLPGYRRMGVLTEASGEPQVVQTLPAPEWQRLFSNDAWNLVMRCILHSCGQSCWKYSKPGMPPTCRHGMQHAIVFPEHNVKGRRPGKRLRNQVNIVAEDEGGMLGRLESFQEHPFEGPTNYTGLVSVRCNLDVQDLRRVITKYAPPELPCVGPRADWSWMNSGGRAFDLQRATFPNEAALLALAAQEHAAETDMALPFRAREEDVELRKLLLLMFMDTHNTGFYVNSYTTKMGIGMAEFMQHLRAGIERLLQQISEEETRIASDAVKLGSGPKSLGTARRAAKMLLRINTSYAKCKHVGGSELVFPMLFGHMCYQTHKCWNVWTKTAVWRALESWRRAIGSIHKATGEDVVGPESVAYADRGVFALLPKGWERISGGAVRGPDGSIHDNVKAARGAFLASQAMHRHMEVDDISRLADFFFKADEEQECLEVDGAVVTTNQLDDYINRSEHPLLAPMTLYVYSMWVSRVELNTQRLGSGQVVIPFSPLYKLATGYGQLITVIERVPKIDGYTMPPPRAGGAGTIADLQLNAMFKSVIHRPTPPTRDSSSVTQDPLEPYKIYHEQPSEEDPSYPWSLGCAFSGAWYAHFTTVQMRARAASRKLLARQELESLWETQEMQNVLAGLSDLPTDLSEANAPLCSGLDCERLTCEEYVAHVTVDVVQNMDAIAWARVNRKTRMPELHQYLEPLDGGSSKSHARDRDADEDVSNMMSTPGLLRKVAFPFKDLETAFQHVHALGHRSTDFAKTLNEFCEVQQLSVTNTPMQPNSFQSKQFGSERARAVADLRSACGGLHLACQEPTFVGECLVEQSRIIQEAGGDPADEHCQRVDDFQAGATLSGSIDSVLPQGWIEPAFDSITPSQYITKMLSEVDEKSYPTREQLQVLSVFTEQLDQVKEQEALGVPWKSRLQTVILLLGQGGCGKTWLVQQYIARAVGYAFGDDEAIRMVAFSNPQATNLSSDRFPAYTVHRASQMAVQKLNNAAMNPGEKLRALETFWQPARVKVGEEITMWPAEVFNMGLLRSAWGRHAKCELDMDEYRLKGNLWGKTPLVLELGDPLQMRPVRTVSLFDTKEMLMQRAERGEPISIEAQWGIKAFNTFDYAFELTQTKRFVPGDPIAPFLQSLRDADASTGKVVDVGLWNLFQRRCIKTANSGAFLKDPRLQQAEFQAGYCVSYYWQAVVLFFFARARREASMFSVPLFWVQAADDIKGLDAQPLEEQQKLLKALLRQWNIHDTAHLHTLLPVYVGQRVRLTEKLSAEHRFVQEAEGTLICVVTDPEESQDLTQGEVALRYCPQGCWVCFDDCKAAPLAEKLADKVHPSALDALRRLAALRPGIARPEKADDAQTVNERLVFVPAVTRTFSRTIAGRKWTIRRRQVPLTSAMDRTIQSSQGKTFRGALTGDMGNMNTDRDSFWSAMYVLLSRVTRMDDLLVLRCPPKSFFDDGPPAYLKRFLEQLHGADGKLAAGRQKGDALIMKYGWKVPGE